MLGGAEAPPSKKTKEVKASSRGTKREEPVRVFDPGGSETDKLPGDGKLGRVTSLSFGRGVCRKYSTKDSYGESLSEWLLRVLPYAVCKSVQKLTVRQVVRVVAKLMLSHSGYRIRNDSRFISVSYEADGCRQLLQLMKCSIDAITFCVRSTADEESFEDNSRLDEVAAVLKIRKLEL